MGSPQYLPCFALMTLSWNPFTWTEFLVSSPWSYQQSRRIWGRKDNGPSISWKKEGPTIPPEVERVPRKQQHLGTSRSNTCIRPGQGISLKKTPNTDKRKGDPAWNNTLTQQCMCPLHKIHFDFIPGEPHAHSSFASSTTSPPLITGNIPVAAKSLVAPSCHETVIGLLLYGYD